MFGSLFNATQASLISQGQVLQSSEDSGIHSGGRSVSQKDLSVTGKRKTLARRGELLEILEEIFWHMRTKFPSPPSATQFTAMMGAYLYADRPDLAVKVFQAMQEVLG